MNLIIVCIDGFLSRFCCWVHECGDGGLSPELSDGDIFGCVDGYGRVSSKMLLRCNEVGCKIS